MKIREAFNAITQQIEEAQVTIDQNGEYVFTFADNSFFKLPGDLDKKGVDKALEAHEAANKGQLSQSVIEKANEEKLKNI